MATGRQSYSLHSSIGMATPESLRKDGAVTVAAVPGTIVNDAQHAQRVKRVRLDIGTAPTGQMLIVDVLKNGTTVFASANDRPRILAGEKSGEALPTKTGSDILVGRGDVITANVTQVGSTVAGADLTVAVALG